MLDNFGSLSLTETSPVQSFTEVLDYAAVASFLVLPVRNPPDPAEEATVAGYIAAAREQAEILQGRDLVRKQYDLHLDYWPFGCSGIGRGKIELRTPLVSVDLVKYRDSGGNYTTLTENTDYVVDTAKGVILPVYGSPWPTFTPWPSSAILVRFTSGISPTSAFWADAGSRIKIGMKLLISLWHNKKVPFEVGSGPIAEYPYAVTSNLSQGGIMRVR